jgi:hypothetical protein
MKHWLVLFAVLAIATIIVLGYIRWRSQFPEHRFMRVQQGMTLDEAKAIMGDGGYIFDNSGNTVGAYWVDEWSRNVLHVSLNGDGRLIRKMIQRPPPYGPTMESQCKDACRR